MNRIPLRSFFFVAAASLASAAAGCTPPPAWTLPVEKLQPILLGTWGTAANDLWTVGGYCDVANDDQCNKTVTSMVLHFDGAAWTQMDAGVPSVLWWVTAFAKDDVWIAGEHGTVIHWDGHAFTKQSTGAGANDKLFGIWGSSSKDLWAVGGDINKSAPVVLRFDGSAWRTVMDAPKIRGFGGVWLKVWGSSANDVYLCGWSGTLAHWDGSAWSVADLGATGITSQNLFTVNGRAKDDVYVVGGDPSHGVAAHFDGKSWGAVAGLDLAASQQLNGVFVDGAGDASIVGMSGGKYRHHAGTQTWSDDTLLSTGADLHATWLDGPEDLFAVGGNFNLLKGGLVAHYGQPVPPRK